MKEYLKWMIPVLLFGPYIFIPSVALSQSPNESLSPSGPYILNKGAEFLVPLDHDGDAPVHPHEPDDEHFVVDKAVFLDTECLFRSEGPLTFAIKVDRYVGEVTADGTLRDIDTLIANNVISAKARLLMPAFDVDSNPPPETIAELAKEVSNPQPEIDRVLFNGQELSKSLTGITDQWIMNEFEIPTSLIKFPAERGTNGQKPQAAENTIQINIDTANSEELWCTAIDWAQLEFKAMSPVLLIHGTASGPDTWEKGATEFLDAKRVPYDHQIQLTANGGINNNANELAQIITQRARNFGVDKVHLVAHSKGGLDTRRYLSTHYKANVDGAIKVLSLHTISSPHKGTILSDLAVAQRLYEDPESEDDDIDAFLSTDWWINASGEGPRAVALTDQQVGRMAAFNVSNKFPSSVRLYTYGADADIDDNGTITFAEQSPIFDALDETNFDFLILEPEKAATIAYRLLRNVSSITVTHRKGPFGLYEWDEVTSVPTTAPLKNDLVVTDQSSQHPSELEHFGPLNRNHSTIQDAPTFTNILAKIRADFPLR